MSLTLSGDAGFTHLPLRGDPTWATWELVGPADAPLVVVLGGISAGRHATATPAEPDRTARSSAAFERATLFASGAGGGRVGAARRPGADDNGASDTEKRRDETGACARIGEAFVRIEVVEAGPEAKPWR